MRATSSFFDPCEFSGRIAVITGGTKGLGRHLCQTLLELGAQVFFCGRDEMLGRQLAEDWGGRAHFVRCDLEDSDDIQRFISLAGKWNGCIDYLVNNAAIDPQVAFEESTLEMFDAVVAINLRACFAVSQYALPYLKNGKGKAIVVTGTTNWMIGQPKYTVYSAAKSGLVGFTRSLAHDVGAYGIRANMISPGWIMTERQLTDKVSEKDKEQLLEDTAIHQLLDEDHVTPATLFMLSSAAKGISGQNLVVDGGKYMY